MLSKELNEKVKKIEMPEDMRARILRNCYVKLEEERVKEYKKNTVFRNPMVTVATLVLTQDIKTIVAERGFAIHGHGFKVKKVSLSPIELPTAVENVAIKNDGIRYNLMGQKVDENYKGVVIINGRKTLVR